jgi:hypothetical protein
MGAIRGYKDTSACWLESNHGECCCQCANRLEVYGHPWHYKTMGDKLGFYVCSVFDVMDNDRKAVLTGEHGACECFTKIINLKE